MRLNITLVELYILYRSFHPVSEVEFLITSGTVHLKVRPYTGNLLSSVCVSGGPGWKAPFQGRAGGVHWILFFRWTQAGEFAGWWVGVA